MDVKESAKEANRTLGKGKLRRVIELGELALGVAARNLVTQGKTGGENALTPKRSVPTAR